MGAGRGTLRETAKTRMGPRLSTGLTEDHGSVYTGGEDLRGWGAGSWKKIRSFVLFVLNLRSLYDTLVNLEFQGEVRSGEVNLGLLGK